MIQLPENLTKKLEEAFDYYKDTKYPLLDRLYWNDYIRPTEGIKELEVINNSLYLLSFENEISVHLLYGIKKHFDKEEYISFQNATYLQTIHQELKILFDGSKITNKAVIRALNACYQIINFSFGKGAIELIYKNAKIVAINNHINELRIDFLKKHNFIKKVNYRKLGNTFKVLAFQSFFDLIQEGISDEIRSINAILEYKNDKNSVLHASIFEQTIREKSGELIDDNHIEILDFKEEEYLEFQRSSLSFTKYLDPSYQLTDSIKECFVFKSKSQKGIARLLYPLLAIVIDNGDFPNYKEWEKQMQELGQMDDKKAWATHVRHKVNKYIKLRDLFD